jgi:hypothetical protein
VATAEFFVLLHPNPQPSTTAWLPGAVATAELFVGGLQMRMQVALALLPDPTATDRSPVSANAEVPLPFETATDFLSMVVPQFAVPD